MESRAAGSPKPFGRRADHRQIIIAKGDDITAFTVNPVVAGAVIGFLILFGVVYLGATTYLFFRDDLIGAAIARQARMQHAYEDRIAGLRAEIDRITSRQLIDQESFEIKLDKLLTQQSSLHARQLQVAQVIEKARETGLKLATATPAAETPNIDVDTEATGGIGGTLEETDPMKSSAVSPGLFGFGGAPSQVAAKTENRFGRELGQVETNISTMVHEHSTALDAIAYAAEKSVTRFETVFSGLGVRLAKAEPIEETGGTGGPYVPLKTAVFGDQVKRAMRALDRLNQLKESASHVPLFVPVRNAKLTSRYGPRLDPFLRRPAMHTGIDFRGKRGKSVLATAKGRVILAERNGGYGLSVEIDHGKGITTRYAHLSRILVDKGDYVSIGSEIGLIGSTGRSTGPHLHYETRVHGKAVDPMQYLNAGKKLTQLLK